MNHDNDVTATGTLHRLTSYVPDRDWDVPIDDPRILRDFQPNDFDRLPWFVKRYDSALPRTPLPRELPGHPAPALEVLAGAPQGTGASSAVLGLAELGRVLFLSAGVVRTSERDYGTHLFRAAGSAGGRFPLELYVAIPDGAGSVEHVETAEQLPPGVHWYDPVDHALVRIGPAPQPLDAGATGPAGPMAPTVVVTGIPWRTGWRYAERGFRHVYWDAGTMLSQLLALGESAGLSPCLYSEFPDQGVSGLVGADRIHEWPVAVVTLGTGAPALGASGPASTGRIDADPLEFPLVTAAQHAGDLEHLGGPWPSGPAVAVAVPAAASAAVSGDRSLSLDEVIAKRGSQRRMDPDRGLPLETLTSCMAVALRGIDVDHWVAVHDVAGLAPGVYRWPDLTEPVWQAASAEVRAELHRVCLDQALARDAAFVVIAATDAGGLSDNGYRQAQLAAGIAEGRLHLAAYALGASATGMTFVDSEVPALLAGEGAGKDGGADAEARDLAGLLFTCVGVAGNSTKPGGTPGAPTEVRRVSPRD